MSLARQHVWVGPDTTYYEATCDTCLSRRDRTQDGCATSRGYALTLHLARDGRAAELLHATLIDPSLWLCDDAVCATMITEERYGDAPVAVYDDATLSAELSGEGAVGEAGG